MFKEFGQIAGVLKSLPKLREQMEELQQKVGQISAEGNAGGGMVTVRANGNMEIVACNISDETMEMNDKEMLEDLIKAAANQAIQKVRQQVAEETSKMASGFGLPPGLELPGLG